MSLACRTSDIPPADEPKSLNKTNYLELSRPSKRPRLSPPPPSRQPPRSSRRERSPPPPSTSTSASRQRSPLPSRRSAPSPPPLPPPPPPPPPPPRRSATPVLVLPPILSPTLPKVIEDALAAEDNLDDEVMAKPTHDVTPMSVRERGKASQSSKKPPVPSSTPSGRSPRSVASPAKTIPKKSSLGAIASKTTGKRPASPSPSSPRSRISVTSSKHPPAASTTAATPAHKTCVVKFRFKRRLKDFQSFCKISLNKRPRPSASLEESNGGAKPKTATGSLGVPKASTARSPAFKSPALKTPATEREVLTPPQKKANGIAGGKKPERAAITPASNRDDRNGVRKVTSYTSNQLNTDYEKYVKQNRGRLQIAN